MQRICILLAVLVFAVFSPTLRNGFVGYDDPDYVTANPHVNTGLTAANIAWAFTAAHSSNWHPLTWISHQLDWTLYKDAPFGHHLTNLLLHVANTLLLFLFLARATGALWRSAFVAAVFGLHPLHVESVAWIAERKDVLSTFFWMLTLLAYTSWTKRPHPARYALVLACFTAGLLSKQMLVTLPLLLLILDWWPLHRLHKRAALEKIPLLALAIAASAAAFWAQRQNASIAALDQLPVPLRLANAVVSYIRYLGKTIWPTDLAVIYPFPVQGIAAWTVAAGLLALAAITAAVIAARRNHPWLATGWGWYMLTLVPVIGLVQIGMQSMADRYMYVPIVGLLIAVAWELGDRRWAPVAAAAVLALCAVLSWRQIAVWHDGLTLFTHAAAVTTDNFIAHDNLGVEFDRRGRFDEAIAQYRETIRIRPGDLHGEDNLAKALFARGERLAEANQFPQALAAFQEGLRYRPANPLIHTYTGLIQSSLGQYDAALHSFDAALRLQPDFAPAQAARAQLVNEMRR